jgi:hypothetical protein
MMLMAVQPLRRSESPFSELICAYFGLDQVEPHASIYNLTAFGHKPWFASHFLLTFISHCENKACSAVAASHGLYGQPPRIQVVPRFSGDDRPGPNTRCPRFLFIPSRPYINDTMTAATYDTNPFNNFQQATYPPNTTCRETCCHNYCTSFCAPSPYTLHRADASSVFRPSILMGKHWHTSSGRSSEPKQASQPTTTTLPTRLSRTSPTPTPQPASGPEGLTSEQPSEKKPVRTRVPAVTSKARTTAPEKDNSRRNRRKHPG